MLSQANPSFCTPELIQFLLDLCKNQLAITNLESNSSQLEEHLQKQFAFIRLQATLDKENPWTQLFTASTYQTFEQVSEDVHFNQNAATFCNTLLTLCQREITPEANIHWSVGFLKNNYEQRILERFVELEKYEHITWLAEHVNAQKKILKALQALPDAAEAFLKTVNFGGESKEGDQNKKISLIESILKQTSGPNAGFARRTRDEFIRQILIDVNITADEADLTKLYQLVEDLYPLSPDDKQQPINNEFISSIIRPFSIQNFLYDTITKPCADLSNKIFATANLLNRASEVVSTSSVIDRLVHSGLFLAEASDQFSATRTLVSGVKTLAGNAYNNEISPVINAITYLFSSSDKSYQDNLIYKIVLQNNPLEIDSQGYLPFLHPNLNSLFDVYLFLENYQEADRPAMFADIKQLFSIEIEYAKYVTLCKNTFEKLQNNISIKIPHLLELIQKIPAEKISHRVEYYSLLLYKLHKLEKEFLKTPVKSAEERIELLQSLKLIINNNSLPKALKDHCTHQYKKLCFSLYADHYKLLIEELIDTGAHELKLESNDAIVFNAELSELYTQLEAGNLCCTSVTLLKQKKYFHNSRLSDLQRFYNEYHELAKNSYSKPINKIKQTPKQQMQQLIDPPLKIAMSSIANAAIDFIKSHTTSKPPVIKEPLDTPFHARLKEEYSSALLKKKEYATELLSTLRGLKFFIEKDSRFSEVLANLLTNSLPATPNISSHFVIKNAINCIIKFGPSNSGDTITSTKIIEYCIATYLPENVKKLIDAHNAYRETVKIIHQSQPELIFSLSDPLNSDGASSENLANSITEQIFDQLNVSKNSQATLTSVMSGAASLLGNTPAAMIAKEIAESQTLHNYFSHICPSFLSSAFFSAGNEAKTEIKKMLGIVVKQQLTATVAQTCFKKFNAADAKSIDADPVPEEQMEVFINFLTKIYSLTLHYGTTNEDLELIIQHEDLELIIQQILIDEGTDSEDIINLGSTLSKSFKDFHDKYIKNYSICTDLLEYVANSVEITNKFQLLMFRKRIELYLQSLDYLENSQNSYQLFKIEESLALLKNRMCNDSAPELYNEIFSRLNATLYNREMKILTRNVTNLDNQIKQIKSSVAEDIGKLSRDRGPLKNWISDFNRGWFIPVTKLVAKFTPFVSSARTFLGCISTFPAMIPIILALKDGPSPLIPLIKYAVIGLSSTSTLGAVTIGLITVSFLSNAMYELYLARNEWYRNNQGKIDSFLGLYSLPKAVFLPLVKAAAKTILPYMPLYAVYKTMKSVFNFLGDTYQSFEAWRLGEHYKKTEIDLLENKKKSLIELKDLKQNELSPQLDNKAFSEHAILTSPINEVRDSLRRLKEFETKLAPAAIEIASTTNKMIKTFDSESKSSSSLPPLVSLYSVEASMPKPVKQVKTMTAEDINQVLIARKNKPILTIATQTVVGGATATGKRMWEHPLATTVVGTLVALGTVYFTSAAKDESNEEKSKKDAQPLAYK